MRLKFVSFLLLVAIILQSGCANKSSDPVNNPPQTTGDTINEWLTTANGAILLQKQNPVLFNNSTSSHSTITVDDSKAFQVFDAAVLHVQHPSCSARG